MAVKRTELKCPLCGQKVLKANLCKALEIECPECGASLLITKEEGGACIMSIRPRGYVPNPLPETSSQQ